MITLKVKLRDKNVSPESIRKAGDIPAIFYGKKEPSTPISLKMVDFIKVWKQAGESSVVTLETPEGEKESLIHDIDFDPVKGTPRHADFYVFEKGRKVEVEVPLEFEGVAPAIKDLGGSLVRVVHALRVEAMPREEKEEEVAPIDLSAIEVEKKGKEEVEGEGAESTEAPKANPPAGGKKAE